jgi:hypothetical protein
VLRNMIPGAFMAILLTSCSHSIHQVYVSAQDRLPPAQKTGWIDVEKDDFVVLGFTTTTDYVEKAYKELESKCNGRISQVSTEHLTSYYFLSYKQRIRLKGLCVSA